MKSILRGALLSVLIIPAIPHAQVAPTQPPTLLQANDVATLPGDLGDDANIAARLRVQVLLDRAQFAPGEIDARWGSNT